MYMYIYIQFLFTFFLQIQELELCFSKVGLNFKSSYLTNSLGTWFPIFESGQTSILQFWDIFCQTTIFLSNKQFQNVIGILESVRPQPWMLFYIARFYLACVFFWLESNAILLCLKGIVHQIKFFWLRNIHALFSLEK